MARWVRVVSEEWQLRLSDAVSAYVFLVDEKWVCAVIGLDGQRHSLAATTSDAAKTEALEYVKSLMLALASAIGDVEKGQ